MSLARIRQLSAHEVGHTLGFAHNFAASSYNRASVMDYPAPWVEIKRRQARSLERLRESASANTTSSPRGSPTRTSPPTAGEPQELEKILEEGVAKGMLYIGDSDGRPVGSAHPLASVWDNGDAMPSPR